MASQYKSHSTSLYYNKYFTCTITHSLSLSLFLPPSKPPSTPHRVRSISMVSQLRRFVTGTWPTLATSFSWQLPTMRSWLWERTSHWLLRWNCQRRLRWERSLNGWNKSWKWYVDSGTGGHVRTCIILYVHVSPSLGGCGLGGACNHGKAFMTRPPHSHSIHYTATT